MANLFDIGVSGLLATRRALGTISHNITNANTEGYSRQRLDVAARQPQYFGTGFFGKGVDVKGVERQVDDFLVGQVRVGSTNLARADALHQFATQLDNLVADPKAGLATALQDFNDSLQDLANDPASVPTRTALLAGADTLTSRFHSMHARIDDLYNGVNQKISGIVDEVNGLARSIADINDKIAFETGRAGGAPPNDLLDQRDKMLLDLSRYVGVNTFSQDDGSINVLIGNGQVLVHGAVAEQLGVAPNALDPLRKEITYIAGPNTVVISDAISSGELAGVVEFRENMLDGARNALGRVGAAMAQVFNAQHREGMDLDGSLGGDLFTLPAPAIAAAAGNTGSVSLAFDGTAPGGLKATDYDLTFDGTNFQLRNIAAGTTQTLSGAGPFSVDGLTLTVGSAPAAGDQWLLQPMRYVARDIAVAVSDPRDLAAAAPIRTRAQLANGSDARISAGEVLDPTNAALLTTTTLVFNNPPTTYQVNGAGPQIAYTSGANIDLNGWRVQISGTPRAGDQFVVQSNAGGVSDNRNGLLLGALASTDILDGGSATLQEGYAQLVSGIGSDTRKAEVSRTALSALLDNAEASRQSVSGVNLDQEAADLLRYQQAFQAAARVISTADTVFQALLDAVRR